MTNDRLLRWLASPVRDDSDETRDEGEEEFVRKLASDPFQFMDELAAERRGISVRELRAGYLRGRRRGGR